MSNARSRARDSRRIADIKQIQLALHMFHADEGEYPNPTEALHNLGSTATTGELAGTHFLTGKIESSENAFLNPIPSAPEPSDNPCDSDENKYRYTRVNADSYQLYYCLGNSTGGIPAGEQVATQDTIFNPN